ncbi:MAG: tail fiber domain-containing protein, partial [Chitinophagaceae bacterium]|nr:tail fiber domain-containing protein [Chitinophagaceae bacterium]
DGLHVADSVGIGTTNPTARLEVAGQVKITGGAPGAGKVLTSDANGLATWQTGGAGPAGADGKTVLNGTLNPSGGTGVDGDFYINTATNQIFGPKTAGAWGSGTSLVGPAGATGATGPQGATGATGPQGPTGPAGATGAAGTNGKTVLNGNVNPASGTGVNGDFYINTATNQIFGPKTAGAWGSGTSLVGPAGATGATGPQGPTGATGPQGPIGLTGATGPAGANGTNGLDGKTVLNGNVNPAAGTGVNGDFYINTATNQIFGPKTAGAWGSGTSLVGPTGATGATGPQGATGATGAQGPIGLTGATGPQGPAGATGPAGANGSNGKTVLNGNVNPGAGTGVDGDFYINTATNQIFGPKTAGAWGSGTSLVGPAGATGATGPQGPTGATGAQGPAGLLSSGSAAGNTPYWNGSSWVVNSNNIYNNGGNVGIGTSAPLAKLEVNGNTRMISSTSGGPKLIISNQSFVPLISTESGSMVYLNTTDSKTGYHSLFEGNVPIGISTAFSSRFESIGNANLFGMYNTFASASGTGSVIGIRNWYQSGSGYTTSYMVGLLNDFDQNTSNTIVSGADNNFTGTGTGTRFGMRNTYSGTGNAYFYGINTDVSTTGTGLHYGEYVSLSGTGTGNKYAYYADIPSSAGGTHYGIFSNVTKATSFAGYFLGRVSIGTTTVNNYILPLSRGTNGQVMQTDANGFVYWVNPSTLSITEDDPKVGTLTSNFVPHWNVTQLSDGLLWDNGIKVGIGTVSPSARFHVADSSVVFTAGASLPGSPAAPPVSGNGRRMMWYVEKAAFRAGNILASSNWNKDSIGNYSAAFGVDTKAKGPGSFAFGSTTYALGFNSMAGGYANQAWGDGSMAMGNNTIANGINSFTTGDHSDASGTNASALGYYTKANGYTTLAIGRYNDSIVAPQTTMQTTTPLFIIGNGTALSNRKNVMVARNDGRVGIGVSAPVARLHVADSAVVFTATNDTTNVTYNNYPPLEGQGRRMMWYPERAAFRVGGVDGIYANVWDRDSIGDYSIAMGRNNKASGSGAFAMGNNSAAKGKNSFVFGKDNNAIGEGSVAFGYSNSVYDFASFAMGSNNISQGMASSALGQFSQANGDYSLSVGWSNHSNGISSIALGDNTYAVGNTSVSMGHGTYASGYASVALGSNSNAIGDSSVAMGSQTHANGERSTAIGYSTNATGLLSTAIGSATTASGWMSTALGFGTIASGYVSTTFGESCTASANNSTAMGINSIANGDYATAMGSNTKASGLVSTAMGYFSSANGSYSTALGRTTIANGYTSLVIGQYNDSIIAAQSSMAANTPLFIIGNGTGSTARSNVMVARNNGRVGIGVNAPGGQFELSLDEGRKPSTNTWTITSDARLKTIHGNYSKGLKEILQLNPITYHYKNTEGRTFSKDVLQTENIGFSAQEVQQIFPECVGTDEDGYLNLNNHAMIVAYVNAIKELNEKNEKLSQENEKMKLENIQRDQMMAELLKRLEALEKK